MTATRVNRIIVAGLALAFVLSALSLSGVSLAAPKWKDPGETEIVAEFPRTVGLYKDSDVRVDGLEAGHVTDVEPLTGKVRVTMKIDDVAVVKDAVATVRLQSLIGERYVELGPVWTGKGPKFESGGVIPLSRTNVPAEVTEVLDELGRVAEGIDKDALGKLIHEMAAGLQGGRDALAGTITGLADTGEALSARAAEIDHSLAQLQRVVGVLAQRDDRIVDVLQNSAAVSDALLAQDGALDQAISGLDDLLSELTNFTGGQREVIVSLTDRLDRVGRTLAAHENDFGRIVDQLPYFSYGYARAIDHDEKRWYTVNYPQGVLFLPTSPAMNSRGGPGTDHADGRVVPRMDHSESPIAPLVPYEVDGTGATGPGPLLPSEEVGVPGMTLEVEGDDR